MSNWVGSGLIPSEGDGPQLFRGAELVRFHAERRARSKSELRYGEFKCTGCKTAVFPECLTLSFTEASHGKTFAQGSCPDCSAVVMKILGETECNMIQNCINTNTSLSQTDEVKGAMPGRIGKKQGKESPDWYSVNDRIVFEWQIYAGRYDSKTIDAHLASIRDFERVTGGKPFHLIKTKVVDIYRTKLIDLGKLPADAGGKSNSTIRHRASHLSKFFEWLCNQKGYKRLNKDLPGYFALPRSATAQALSRPAKPFPKMEEAIKLASEMPARTRLDRRNRAIFALAFVSGFRASALSSLRLRHVDIVAKRVVHDAADIRAKNGKSYTANWFPRTEPLQKNVVEWIKELELLGFGQNDALFPHCEFLVARHWPKGTNRAGIEPMRTSLAVTEAFKAATSQPPHNYSPHSARHSLAALGDQLCRSSEDKKAWSLNLGHSSEKTTQTHYAKVTDTRKCEIFEAFNETDHWTDEEKDLMLDFHDCKFQRGTPEYERARALVNKRAGVHEL